MSQNTVLINGQEYDRVTGLPVSSSAVPANVEKSATSSPASAPEQAPVARQAQQKVHAVAPHAKHKPQRSSTLRRRALKKPSYSDHRVIKRSATVKRMDIARPVSAPVEVRKFAPHPAAALHPKPATIVDRPAMPHPSVARKSTEQPLTNILTSSQIKDNAIKDAISKTHKKNPLKNSFFKRHRRVASVLSATFAVVMLGGYFTYINMPALSVRVAASQAGIDARYPNYRPDGYALNGPVTYSDNRVSMVFKANAGDQKFTINQVKSSWDSEALLDNYVSDKSNGDYTPVTEHGLKIYTYGDNAAWVNGGILYTVEGNAPLSSSQIRKIATSLL